MKTYFVNEAFEKAINDYLESKNKQESILYNSFLVVVIRMLINIYSELDIINPFSIKNEDALDENLMKYGATITEINNLKRLIDGFYKIYKKNMNVVDKEDNIYFIEVQKCLIDLFTIKRVNFGVTDEEQKKFFELLYTPGCPNAYRISINYKYADDPYEIAEYYKQKLTIDSKKENVPEKQLLEFDVYKQFNISVADLSKMNNDEVKNLNKQIYDSLDISENAINKDYLLKEKLEAIYRKNHPITTGNGYVDILLIMSVIVTTIMVIAVVSVLAF